MSSSNINLEQFFSDTTQLRTEAAKSFDNAILVFKKSNSFSDRNGKAYCINLIIAAADNRKDKVNARIREGVDHYNEIYYNIHYIYYVSSDTYIDLNKFNIATRI